MCLGIFQMNFKNQFCSAALLLLSLVNTNMKRRTGTHMALGNPPSPPCCDHRAAFCLRFWLTAAGVFKQTRSCHRNQRVVSSHPYSHTLKRVQNSQPEVTETRNYGNVLLQVPIIRAPEILNPLAHS